MLKAGKWRQFTTMFTLLVRLEFADKQRTLSPIMFSATLLILTAFSLGELYESKPFLVYIATTFLTLFYTLQISFARIFDHELEDDAFTLLRISALQPEVWFVSKLCFVILWASLVMLATFCINGFLNQKYLGFIAPPSALMLVAFCTLTGLAPLGILLAAMTQRTKGSHIVYPLVYFPLTSPVLIAAVQACSEILYKHKDVAQLLPNWLGLLLIFNVIYITLSTLLFGELLKAD